jgi:TadE-like protein
MQKKMIVTRRSYMLGQATTEFVISCLVLIPLFMGVVYVARYADVKHSAIQASRYAAFERAFDPYSTKKSDAQLADETRARFFTPISYNQGKIKFRDSVGTINKDTVYNPVWVDLRGKRLLREFNDVGISMGTARVNDGALGSIFNGVGRAAFGLQPGGMHIAQVEVPLLNITHFDALKNINIKLAAQTAIGGTAWNASSSDGGDANSTCARVARSPMNFGGDIRRIIPPIDTIMDILVIPFEPNGPRFGYTAPDIVPQRGVLSGTQGRVACR